MSSRSLFALGLSLLGHTAILWSGITTDVQTPQHNIASTPQRIQVQLVDIVEDITPIKEEKIQPLSEAVKEKIISSKVASTHKIKDTPAEKASSPNTQTEKIIAEPDTINSAEVIADIAPVIQNNRAPNYPRSAKKRGYEGTVTLKIEVLESGHIGQVQIQQSSGYRTLDQAAIKAVKKWTFQPATLESKPVVQWVDQPIHFKLKKHA